MDNQRRGDARGMWADPSVWRLKLEYQRINILSRIAARFPKEQALRVLEFGPGLGCLVELVHQNYAVAEYHVADVDGELLESLTERFPFVQAHHIKGAGDGVFGTSERAVAVPACATTVLNSIVGRGLCGNLPDRNVVIP